MKIPRFQHSGVPSAEQKPVGAIVSAGRSKMYGPLNTLNKVIQNFGEQALDAEKDAEYHRLSREMENETRALLDELEQKERFDTDGAPTHDQLMPEFEKGYRKLRAKFHNQTKFRANGQALSEAFDLLGDKYSTHARSVVRGRQIDYLKGEVVRQLDGLDADVENGMAKFQEVATNALASNVWSPEQYEKELISFTYRHDVNLIHSGFMSSLNDGAIAAKAYAEQVEYPDTFTQAEVDKVKSYMNRELTVLESREWDKMKANVELLVSGHQIGNGVRASAEHFVSTTTNPERKAAVKQALRVHDQVMSMVDMTQGQRRDLVDSLAGVVIDTPEEMAMYDATMSAYSNIEKSIQRDAYRAYNSMSGDKLSDIDMAEAHDSGTLVEALESAKDNYIRVKAWTGSDIPMLSNEHISQLVRLGPNAIGAIAQLWNREDSQKVLALMYDKNYKELARAGQLSIEEDGHEAWAHYQNGARVSANEKAYQPSGKGENKRDPLQVFDELTSKLWPGDDGISSASKKVADKIYASLSARDADMSGVFNEARYEEAIRLAVGGVVTWKGSTFVPPNRTWATEHVKSLMSQLTMDHIDLMGGFKQSIEITANQDANSIGVTITPHQVLKGVKDGRFELAPAPSGERGHYVLVSGDRIVSSKRPEGFDPALDVDKPFILDLTLPFVQELVEVK